MEDLSIFGKCKKARDSANAYGVVYQNQVTMFYGRGSKNEAFDGDVDTSSLSRQRVEWDGVPMVGSFEEAVAHAEAWQALESKKYRKQKPDEL